MFISFINKKLLNYVRYMYIINFFILIYLNVKKKERNLIKRGFYEGINLLWKWKDREFFGGYWYFILVLLYVYIYKYDFYW